MEDQKRKDLFGKSIVYYPGIWIPTALFLLGGVACLVANFLVFDRIEEECAAKGYKKCWIAIFVIGLTVFSMGIVYYKVMMYAKHKKVLKRIKLDDERIEKLEITSNKTIEGKFEEKGDGIEAETTLKVSICEKISITPRHSPLPATASIDSVFFTKSSLDGAFHDSNTRRKSQTESSSALQLKPPKPRRSDNSLLTSSSTRKEELLPPEGAERPHILISDSATKRKSGEKPPKPRRSDKNLLTSSSTRKEESLPSEGAEERPHMSGGATKRQSGDKPPKSRRTDNHLLTSSSVQHDASLSLEGSRKVRRHLSMSSGDPVRKPREYSYYDYEQELRASSRESVTMRYPVTSEEEGDVAQDISMKRAEYYRKMSDVRRVKRSASGRVSRVSSRSSIESSKSSKRRLLPTPPAVDLPKSHRERILDTIASMLDRTGLVSDANATNLGITTGRLQQESAPSDRGRRSSETGQRSLRIEYPSVYRNYVIDIKTGMDT